MIKQLLNDESGLSTIEILVGMIVLVILAIISFYALKGGVHKASNDLGGRVGNLVDSAKVEPPADATVEPSVTLEF